MARERGKSKAAKVGRSSKAPLACVVLAAGQGTRMRSAQAKVLHEVLGRPLVAYPVELAQTLGAAPVVAVLGHQRDKVEAALTARFGAGAIRIAEQTERHGTGHAVRVALPALRGAKGILLVLSGDVPLLQRKTLSALVGMARRYSCLAVLTTTPRDPTGYGRIVRDSRGHVLRIVEHKDATAEERAVTEVNAGIYAAPIEFFRKVLPTLQARNAQHEYYLTDIVARAAEGIGVSTVDADFQDVGGVNDRSQLVEAEAMLQARVNARWMAHATFRDAGSTVIEPDVVIGVDVELGRGVALRGRTRIGHGARIGDGCLLTDTEVGAGAEVKPYTVATDAVIAVHAKVGPFAHLRPGAVVGPEAHVGNFVELKKTRLGRGSKVNHLSYLGDAVIGDGVNIGAGTITCNYNGYEKTRTIIEDGAFIGSDSQLVAPVTVGRKAVVAAGTTVTEDVPAGALAIGRSPQVAVPGYAEKLARRYPNATKPQKRGPRVSG
ncbi:MAG TPA: bifunctional UDP-N-acetylglucosamine diphosphorylase/glucosamine-1-phosphate N-acetyltransferase GlmU [Polyangia bacterium]